MWNISKVLCDIVQISNGFLQIDFYIKMELALEIFEDKCAWKPVHAIL